MRELSFSELDWDDAILRIDGDGYPLKALDITPDPRGTPFIAAGQTPMVPEDRYVIAGPLGRRLCQIHVSTHEKQEWWRFEDAISVAKSRHGATTVLVNRLGGLQDYSALHGKLMYPTVSSSKSMELVAQTCLQEFRVANSDVNIMFADYQRTPLDTQISMLILYIKVKKSS